MKPFSAALFMLLLISGCSSSEKHLEKQAERIHRRYLIVDTHCDTPVQIVEYDYDMGKKNNDNCVDFPRMKEGGLDAEFFAVFTNQGPRNDSAYQKAYREALKTFDAIHKNVAQNSSMAEMAYSPDDAIRIKKEGKVAAFIGVENGYPLGVDITKLRKFYDLGARYLTLCHTSNNDICDSSNDPTGPEFNGLSLFGAEVVKEMNRLGMMIDVSHLSDKAFYDVLKLSKTPVIASHSSCRALCSSPRNLTDDMLTALKTNGGVIQICILNNYIKTPEPNPELDAKIQELRDRYGDFNSLTKDQRKMYFREYFSLRNKYMKFATVADVVDHIDHVVQVIGVDYVGIGTDFDGGGGVDGCKTVADMKNITLELLRRGYSNRDIGKIWGGNLMRVFREVERISHNNK